MTTIARQPFRAWLSTLTPAEHLMLHGVQNLGLGFARAANHDKAVVLHTVPVILLELDTGAWFTVQRADGGGGKGLRSLLQFLAT